MPLYPENERKLHALKANYCLPKLGGSPPNRHTKVPAGPLSQAQHVSNDQTVAANITAQQLKPAANAAPCEAFWVVAASANSFGHQTLQVVDILWL
jgi:hypothetical protein